MAWLDRMTSRCASYALSAVRTSDVNLIDMNVNTIYNRTYTVDYDDYECSIGYSMR